MKNTIKRITALLLALSMCFSLLRANVWAADTSGGVSAQSSEEDATGDNAGDESEEEEPPQAEEEKPEAEEETSQKPEEKPQAKRAAKQSGKSTLPEKSLTAQAATLNITAAAKSDIVYDGQKLDKSDFNFGGTDAALVENENTTVTVEGHYVCNTGGTLADGDIVLFGTNYRKITGTNGWSNADQAFQTGNPCSVDDMGALRTGNYQIENAPGSGYTWQAYVYNFGNLSFTRFRKKALPLSQSMT